MSVILGMNLLESALGLIDRQVVNYFKNNSRDLNAVGEFVSSYEEPIEVEGSLQPVPRALYDQYGLDYQKDYFTFYALADVIDVSRDVSGDQIEFFDGRYQVESKVAWFRIDEWAELLVVKINDA